MDEDNLIIDDIEIEEDINIDDTLISTEIINNDEENEFYNNYDISKYKSIPILTKYERTLILSERIQHLANGCNPYINTTGIKDIYNIAAKELDENKIPYIIKRIVGNKIELWKLKDLNKLK